MELDLLNGGGWHDIIHYNVGWGMGYAMAETEKKGAGTQMWSKHRNLMFQKDDGSWDNWASIVCVQDEANGWSWRSVGADGDSYDIVNTGGAACQEA